MIKRADTTSRMRSDQYWTNPARTWHQFKWSVWLKSPQVQSKCLVKLARGQVQVNVRLTFYIKTIWTHTGKLVKGLENWLFTHGSCPPRSLWGIRGLTDGNKMVEVCCENGWMSCGAGQWWWGCGFLTTPTKISYRSGPFQHFWFLNSLNTWWALFYSPSDNWSRTELWEGWPHQAVVSVQMRSGCWLRNRWTYSRAQAIPGSRRRHFICSRRWLSWI